MRPLPEDWRREARAWADAPPRRTATHAAARARAAAGLFPHRRHGLAHRPRRVAVFAAAALALAVWVGGELARRAVEAPPPSPARSAMASTPHPAEPVAATRTVVIRLASGTPLYVILPPAAAPEGRPRS
jgi:hypothetical protein